MGYDDWLARPYLDWPSVEDDPCPDCGAGPLQACAEDCRCDWCQTHRRTDDADDFGDEAA